MLYLAETLVVLMSTVGVDKNGHTVKMMLLWQEAIVNLIKENSFIYSDRNAIKFIITVNMIDPLTSVIFNICKYNHVSYVIYF